MFFIAGDHFIFSLGLELCPPFFFFFFVLMGKLRTPDSERCSDLPEATGFVRGKIRNPSQWCLALGLCLALGVVPASEFRSRQGKSLERSVTSNTVTEPMETEGESRGRASYSPAPPPREFWCRPLCGTLGVYPHKDQHLHRPWGQHCRHPILQTKKR